jgi:hypothetical protein
VLASACFEGPGIQRADQEVDVGSDQPVAAWRLRRRTPAAAEGLILDKSPGVGSRDKNRARGGSTGWRSPPAAGYLGLPAHRVFCGRLGGRRGQAAASRRSNPQTVMLQVRGPCALRGVPYSPLRAHFPDAFRDTHLARSRPTQKVRFGAARAMMRSAELGVHIGGSVIKGSRHPPATQVRAERAAVRPYVYALPRWARSSAHAAWSACRDR